MSSDAAAKEPSRNIRIGKYEVLSHIATGGMGAVYKARDTETGLDVALKVLSPEMAAKPAMVERFRREAKHALKLRHKNIVTLHEFGEAQNIHFLVMEFVDGIDLFEYLNRQGPLDPVEALKIIRQACRALDHAYQQGVVHRDIKPSNFLVARQGERLLIKLTDFGLAREASNEEFRVTRAGTTIGTLDYMSPEQARDSGLADVRSDLYSLGCTWYHLLTGHAPFPKGGLGERLHRIMNEEAPDVRQFNPRVSSAMASVLHRLLAKKRSQRYQTPADLMRDLDALKHGQPVLTPRQALEILAQESNESVESPTKQNRRVSDSRRTPSPSASDSDIIVRRRPSDSQIKSATSGRARSETRRRRSSEELPTKSGKSTAELPIEEPESTPPYLLYFLGGSAVIILVVTLVVVLIMMRRGNRGRTRTEQTPQAVSQAFQPARDKWLSLTFDTFAVQSPAVPDFSAPPQIPIAGDGLFHGAQLDLNQTDMGARVLIAQSLLIAGDDAIRLTLDPDFTQKQGSSSGSGGTQAAGKANAQCLLDHATISARGAVLHLPDVKPSGPLEEPVIVQSHDCGFVNLFAGRTSRPSLVKYEGDALAHGLLIWQSENDAFDRRLWFGAVCKDKPLPDKPEDHAS